MISSGNTIANLILVKLLDALIIELGLKIGLMTFGGIVFNIGHDLGVPLKFFLTNLKVKIIAGWKTTADCEILEVTDLHKTKTSGD